MGNYNEVFAWKVSLFTKSRKDGKKNIEYFLYAMCFYSQNKKWTARYALVGICDLTTYFIYMKIGQYIKSLGCNFAFKLKNSLRNVAHTVIDLNILQFLIKCDKYIYLYNNKYLIDVYVCLALLEK